MRCKALVVNRLSTLIALVVASSLLSVSVVYACSGHDFMPMSSMSGAMDDTAMERGPCDKHKQDICKSVRYRMLSVRAPLPVAEIALHVSAVLQSVDFHVPLLINLVPTA